VSSCTLAPLAGDLYVVEARIGSLRPVPPDRSAHRKRQEGSGIFHGRVAREFR